ncbi:spore coat protein [Shouchella shacheensis]|uniref:spore coat protein n=1 Tax=Shouchella shacheensis TaxID=1649580 RepID=UPI00073FF9A4|nr:spore coat protein [Shouchella shacheensis]
MSKEQYTRFLDKPRFKYSECKQPDCHYQDCDGGCSYKKKDDYKWSALDHYGCHPMDDDSNIDQNATQAKKEVQVSEELIFIKDSCKVDVETTDTKAAVGIQVAIQAAIALIIQISIAGSDDVDEITQEILQSSKIKQITRQKTIIENSKDVSVQTTDTQVAINLQIQIAILLALIVELDIL